MMNTRVVSLSTLGQGKALQCQITVQHTKLHQFNVSVKAIGPFVILGHYMTFDVFSRSKLTFLYKNTSLPWPPT